MLQTCQRAGYKPALSRRERTDATSPALADLGRYRSGRAHARPGPGQPAQGSIYVIVHGAWGGSWDWRRADSILTAHGHRVYRPSLTGLGDRVHLASPTIGLLTHITDIVNVLVWEDLHDVILVGHSYGGMVITGVADQVPERIRHLIYLDAFLPDSGESVRTLARPEMVTLFDRSRGQALCHQCGRIRPRGSRRTSPNR